MLVTVDDVRTLRAEVAREGGVLCVDGIEAWCGRIGISLRELYAGVPPNTLRNTGDYWALRLVAIAEKRAQGG